jgi:hypothetical protein
MIEMVDTIRGPVPRVALTRTERVVQDNEDASTVQVDWRVIATGELVRQDGEVRVKRWPEGMNILAGAMRAGG